MTPFLTQVARYLYSTFGSDLHRISLVFPSRRSSVFFHAYLNELVTSPIIGPDAITIDELVSRMSGMQISDQIGLILHLHRVYVAETGHDESLDDFFFWGEILLNDFNDIDKYQLEATDLFRNIKDIKEVETRFDYLTPEQKKAIEAFWGNMGRVDGSVNREKFMAVWNKLPAIYQRFRNELLDKNVGYSGLVYRELIEENERDKVGLPEGDQFVFIGFNALDRCENKLFKRFQSAAKALFFWDFDEQFLNDPAQEAGLFVRRNQIEFPAPEDFVLDEGAQKKQKISLVSVPGQVAQAQVIHYPALFQEEIRAERFDDTVLVLSDESLLVPVISSAGSRFRKINITMGYALQNTPVYSLISLLIDLQKNSRKLDGKPAFYHRPVLALLKHQLIANDETKGLVAEIRSKNKIHVRQADLNRSELLKLIFSTQNNWKAFAEYLMEIISNLGLRFSSAEDAPVKLDGEYLYQAYLSIQRLVDTLDELADQKMSVALFFRLLIQHLQRVSIPFEGEPLTGLQVMGFLETRLLDFKKVVLFSVNEGKMPKSTPVHSFIPYHLRKAFGLPAYEEHDAMYAYYFYRLLHRAEEVVLVYNSATDGLNSGEMSRYLFQLKYDSEVQPKEYYFDFNFKSSGNAPIAIPATVAHQEKLLRNYTTRKLSPSALNTYLDCKLKFYFKHIAFIKESEEVLEDVDPRLFGNLFHYAMEMLYQDFVGKEVQKDHLKALLVNKAKIEQVIRAAFAKEYYKDKSLNDVRISGKNILVKDHLETYLHQLLMNDLAFAPFKVIALEGKYEAAFDLLVGEKKQQIRLGGTIDRIDETVNGTRITDYKTGRNLKLNFREVGQFYERDKNGRPKEIFQTLVYSEIFKRSTGESNLLPTIYKIDDFFDDEFHPEVIYGNDPLNYQQIAEPFCESLDELLREMFSTGHVYDQTEDDRKCRLCPYNVICRRG
ncbi:PD-(D/E)XK nuclease family protein [uncultured Sunxiuqinia sp.]|uniref:PD-(D/E)XK nuclease family protein n=1 Tax=uncultured Sunxiuqinia sp. TaxID=1573825 RepID=UPI0030DCC9C4